MSKTDKTRPHWVQVRDPYFPYKLTAHHRCIGASYSNFKKCNLDFPKPVTRGREFDCELWPKYKYNDKIYGRSGYRRSSEFKQDKRARADLRRLRSKWIKESIREDIDSNENLPTQRWLWRRWYWD